MSAAEPDATPRFVLDETSFDLRAVPPEEIGGALEALADTLEDLVRRPGGVLMSSLLYECPCHDRTDVGAFLFGAPATGAAELIDRDERIRLVRLLDRCQYWDELWGDVPAGTAVTVAGNLLELGFSVGFAALRARSGHNVACVVGPLSPNRGFIDVHLDAMAVEVFFFAETRELPQFWRALFHREDVGEAGFFALAESAFDQLVFAPELAFRRFDGSYSDVRDRVVTILSAINDNFVAAHAEGKGIAHHVQARLGSFGVDISPESPNTRGSAALLKHRVVVVDDQAYLCDWHAKLERHRNRIHFSLPDPRVGDRIVVGVFAAHLPT